LPWDFAECLSFGLSNLRQPFCCLGFNCDCGLGFRFGCVN
jgi:hypothetical protein